MKPIADPDIRASFVNCSKGEASRLNLPAAFPQLPWDDLDFLGWRDPGAPERAYLVAERDGALIGVALRASAGAARSFIARSMCSFCLTTRTAGGVALMTARRRGESGRQGNTVGQYLCTDLACSLYVRGIRKPAMGADMDESLSVDGKIARTRTHINAFLAKVIA